MALINLKSTIAAYVQVKIRRGTIFASDGDQNTLQVQHTSSRKGTNQGTLHHTVNRLAGNLRWLKVADKVVGSPLDQRRE